MATITSTGLGSGLDVQSIVASLMAVESRPLTLLQEAKTKLDTQFSAIGKMKSLTTTMRDAATKLASVSLWNQTTTTSSDASAVAASGAAGSVAASYSVSVSKLAASQTVSSRSFTNSSSTLSEGLLTIELGSWEGEPSPTGFTPKTGTAAVNVVIGAGETSLTAVRDKINAAGAGVTASIINDASGARLSLRSSATGEENAFRISVLEDANDGVGNTGLSALAYDAAEDPQATTPVTQMVRNATAVNAQALVNGINIESASNTLVDVAEGLTLTLNKVTTANVDIAVKADNESVKTAITAFTTAFNALASYITEQTKYDPTSKTGGTLQGDRATATVLSGLRGVINQSTSASSVYTRLSDIGIAMKSDGTLETNTTKLDAAIANRAELRLALATDGGDTATSGFMDRFRDLGAALLDTTGSLTSRSSGLESMMDRNTKSQDAMELRLAQTEKRLRAQYQALDTSMAQMSSLSSYLTGQLASLATTSSS